MKQYEKPLALENNDLSEGIFNASGEPLPKGTATRDHDDGNGVFYNITVPAEFLNTGKRVSIHMTLSEKSTYFDCRAGGWTDGHYSNDAALEAIAYNDDPQPQAQFAFVPMTVQVTDVEFKFE